VTNYFIAVGLISRLMPESADGIDEVIVHFTGLSMVIADFPGYSPILLAKAS